MNYFVFSSQFIFNQNDFELLAMEIVFMGTDSINIVNSLLILIIILIHFFQFQVKVVLEKQKHQRSSCDTLLL